ncbi:MAG: universal stress protein [Elusimicrobia bacterium]|jgi:nucleotide-binding universal stress UspA family protein|nr:universal stress protein [Elusimicrobiota bacterium]
MNILLAVDGSNHSKRASDLLARATAGAHRVTVLNVTPTPVPAPEKNLTSVTEALKKSAVALTEAVARDLRRARGWRARAVVVESMDVAGAVLAQAVQTKADLIVLGARGLNPVKAIFLGSVSQKILERATVPVWIVRGGGRKKSFHAVLAVDGTPGGERASAFLKRFGPVGGARLSLVHAVLHPLAAWRPGPFGLPTEAYLSVDLLKQTRADLLTKGRTVLARAAKRWAGRRPPADILLREGFPAETLLDAAGARGADVIVMGRRGLSRLDRFLIGSVSRKVASHAAGSVLIVP